MSSHGIDWPRCMDHDDVGRMLGLFALSIIGLDAFLLVSPHFGLMVLEAFDVNDQSKGRTII